MTLWAVDVLTAIYGGHVTMSVWLVNISLSSIVDCKSTCWPPSMAVSIEKFSQLQMAHRHRQLAVNGGLSTYWQDIYGQVLYGGQYVDWPPLMAQLSYIWSSYIWSSYIWRIQVIYGQVMYGGQYVDWPPFMAQLSYIWSSYIWRIQVIYG